MELNKDYSCQKIGKGGFGDVYSLNDLNLVVKLLDIDNLSLVELDTMSRLRHQNLMQIIDFGIFETTKNTIKKVEFNKEQENIFFGFVMEKAKTDLRNYIPKSKKETLSIIEQIKQGLFYLHENNIIHGDIKLENILVFDDGNVKLTDFGISKYTSNLKTKDLIANNIAYKPPESLDESVKKIDNTVDYWALGVLIYELITYDTLVFYNMKQEEINDTIIIEFDCLDYAELIDFTKKCLSRDPKDRNVFTKSNSGYNISIYKNIKISDNDIKSIITKLSNIDLKIGYDIMLKMLHFIIINYEKFEDLKERVQKTYEIFLSIYENEIFTGEYTKLYDILDKSNGIINNYSLYETLFRNITKIESLDDYEFIFKHFLKI